MTTGPFGVEVVSKSFGKTVTQLINGKGARKATQVSNQLQRVSAAGPKPQKPGTLAAHAQAVGLSRQMQGPFKSPGSSAKGAQINAAAAKAGKTARMFPPVEGRTQTLPGPAKMKFISHTYNRPAQ